MEICWNIVMYCLWLSCMIEKVRAVHFSPLCNLVYRWQTLAFAYVRTSSCPFTTLFTQRDISEARDAAVGRKWQPLYPPTPGTGTCSLTFGDIITLPIRSLLSFVRSDELVRVSTWDGEPGQSRASPWAQTDKRRSLPLPPDPHASYATKPQHGTSVPPAETGPGTFHLYPSSVLYHLLSLAVQTVLQR